MNDGEIRVAELFAGIGGFRLGLERANSIRTVKPTQQQRNQNLSQDYNCEGAKINIHGSAREFRIIWANEWDKHATAIYRKNFGEKELKEADIKTVDPKDIPDCDVLCGGFPCQPFSMAGKRQGFQDIRGTLFFEIMRIAQVKRPKILFLENVKGLLNHGGGDTFETILRTLGNAGYWYEYKVLNSKYAGVPQNRERVFIIGHLRTASTRQVFPFTSDGEEDYNCGEVAGCLQGGGHSGGLHSNMTAIVEPTILPAVPIQTTSPATSHRWDVIQIGALNKGSQAGRIYDPQGIAPTLHKSGGCTEPLISQALQTDGYLRSGSSFGTDKPQSSRNIRRLTPTECERLQGFPDSWTAGVSDTQRYKCLGNAVTVPVIQAIGELLLEALA